MAGRSPYTFEPVWDDGEFVLSHTMRPGEQSPLLLMTPAQAQPAPVSLARLEHAYRLRDELDSTWAARPVALVQQDGHPALLIEDPGGELLARLVGKTWDLMPFLRVAVGLTVSIGRLHARGLIHKDIKPANILVNTTTGDVWLAGFGLASRLARERQAPDSPDVIAGTLPYMAPEQTGRMNRSIDARSDLYSLGVTLYELLTGKLPFTASDPMEWIHCHIARKPMPPNERVKGIPGQVAAIVMKLLAKTAEHRYQTAAGVEADLRSCLTTWEAHGCIDEFPLGARDVSDTLLIPERLYGRERQIAELFAAFERVLADGTPQLVLVSGYAGVGKSSVVHELYKALVPPRGLFASGKFEQYKRDIPYATVAQALQSLVRRILGESEADLVRWRDAITQAVGPNGQLIVNLIPEVELVIGIQPPLADVSPHDAQTRFQMVFRRFLGVFATSEHPLALFLDDLQWLDAATLDLLVHLVTDQEVRHLLLVGAYRDNEVDPSHPLMQTLDAIRRADGGVREIVLAPLTLDDVGRLISESLHGAAEDFRPLAELVHEKTGGNPFFVNQFLTALVEEGLLAFDAGAVAWTWNLAHIRAKGYTDNVVDLMVGKLNRLPDTTQEAVKQLACLGNSAEVATLSVVHGVSTAEMHTALWEAVRAGLVFRSDDTYTFLHDRVQEAAYSLIPEGERGAAHRRIGRLLASRTVPEGIEEKIFEIVNQLDRGLASMYSAEERVRIAELNLIAGKRAKTSTAYASALTYFAAGCGLLGDDRWERQYRLAFDLEFQRAECQFLTGDPAGAEERLSELSGRATNLADIAAAVCLRLALYTRLDRSDRAIEMCLEYLRRVGIAWSLHPTEETVRQEYERMWQQVGSRPIEALIDLPPMSDPNWRATMDVLAQVMSCPFFTDMNLRCLVLGRMANLSLEHGNCDASCYAYVWLGMTLGPHFGNYQAGFRFGKLSVDLVEKRGLDRFKAAVEVSFGYRVIPWTRHVRTGRALVRHAIDAAQEVGDLTFASYSHNCWISLLLVSGDPLSDAQQEAEQALEFVRKVRFGLMVDAITGQLRLIQTLRGLSPKFGAFSDDLFDEDQFERHLEADPGVAIATCFYWINKLQARFFAADYVSAIAAAAKAQRLLWTLPSCIEIADYHFYAALACAARSDTASTDEQPDLHDAILAHHEPLAQCAENCPENFGERAALVAAEIARLDGRELDAERLYEEAIRLAQEHGFVQNEGLANELAARFYTARGFETIARTYLRHARYCYLRWGADGKVRQLEQRHPYLREDRAALGPTATIAASVEGLDLGTVVEMSHAISEEIVLEKLIHRLLVMAVEHAGAERGVLILPHGEGQRVAAEATTGQEGITVRFVGEPPARSSLPDSILKYVARTQQDVMLDDASLHNLFSTDDYIARNHVRSVLCLPLVKQGGLTGVLYLENNLASHVFTPGRIEVLKLLASQAAISVDNARLYADVQASEDRLCVVIDTIPAMVGSALPDGSTDFLNERWLEYTGLSLHDTLGDKWATVIHPDDRAGVQDAWRAAMATGEPYEHEARTRRADGQYRWFLYRALPLRDAHGTIVRWFAAGHDIDDQRRAEERVRQDERDFRQLVDFVPSMIGALDADGRLYLLNRAGQEYLGQTLEELTQLEDVRSKMYHPDDLGAVRGMFARAFSRSAADEVEARVRRHDGQYRWFLIRYDPVRDEHGRVVRWYGTATDIEDRKQAEERVIEENLALREEVDKASMFEEIVGASPPLRTVLSLVSKVAPMESTVLITGETGTGKELVARAIHRLSPRAPRPFVSVNCAAIPQTLIASELFGHERGAFTGALERRRGRFELAEGGTIFMDEVGELTAETQIALLRVLQEREFERVGGSRPLTANVRVIAATNRDLPAAIAAGTFRADLFYRLNVFPVSMPPLRTRRDDIPVLVSYFVERFARRAGKRIRGIHKKSLERLQAYPWPGNIRELQNVIERSVIVADGETLSVDERWLHDEPTRASTADRPLDQPLADRLTAEQKTLIEAALAETRGRVSGPAGAAAKLGMRSSTLESRIRSLGIDKRRFRTL